MIKYFLVHYKTGSLFVTSQSVYICCYDKVQAKGLAVSKREAKKEGGKKRLVSNSPDQKICHNNKALV